MSDYRKRGVLVAAAALAAVTALTSCSAAPAPTETPAVTAYVPQANPPRPADCPPPSSADLARSAGWLGQIAAHPGDVGFVVDDGRGRVVSHAADAQQPLASAAKVVHLAAYARAVAEGRVRADETVRVADWERWYLPGTDGGAHPKAMARLGLAVGDPARTATVDQMVSAMVQESDNATTDWLRDRLGDDALTRAAADVGWTPFDLPSELGSVLAVVLPEMAPPIEAPRAEGGPAEIALARRYAADPAFRAEAQRRLTSLSQDVEGYLLASEAAADQAATGSAAQLAGTYRALVSDAYGPGADLAMRHLEWQGPVPGVGTLGFKGGTLTGVLTLGSSLRREDGTVGVGVLLARRLPATADLSRAVVGQQGLVIGALSQPRVFDRLVCVA